MEELPIVRTKSDIEKNGGEKVQLIGHYRQIDVRMRPHGSPIYKGHVVIVLEDSTNVLLYPTWHDKAKRPSEEITTHENEMVTVTGTIYSQAPNQKVPDNPNIVPSSMVTPCVFPVDSVTKYQAQ